MALVLKIFSDFPLSSFLFFFLIFSFLILLRHSYCSHSEFRPSVDDSYTVFRLSAIVFSFVLRLTAIVRNPEGPHLSLKCIIFLLFSFSSFRKFLNEHCHNPLGIFNKKTFLVMGTLYRLKILHR